MTDSTREQQIYGMAPQIRFTLMGLYIALVLPLPVMAQENWQPYIWAVLVLGFALVLAITSEQVILDGEGLRYTHPVWCRWFLRRGWELPWAEVQGLTPVATSQGGRVFYVRTAPTVAPASARMKSAYLLPQRVENFPEFLSAFSAFSGIATDSVARITPPWTYQLLAIMSGAMIVGEVISLAKIGG
ncbi:MAG: hypothetical protein ACH34U_05700 [Cyanobium sp.]|jgi:hypothetical protein